MIFLRGKGIVISKKEIEEADRYITVFMEDYGKISTLVRGIRKSKKRDKTAADVLSLTDFSFYRKGETIILSDFNGIESYQGIKSDLEKLNIALYLFSVLNQILVENDRNRKLYNILLKTLEYLDKTEDEKKNLLIIVYFLYELIKIEGIYQEITEFLNFLKKEQIVKISIKEEKILEDLLSENIRKIIQNEMISINEIRKIIIILEKYINFNLDMRLDIRKFLWGDLLW
ncbi:MAG: DNA repair protein RecO [Fusobacterium sp.]|nr:DNA repair protein RecO [Fusobacterium sp.]